MLACQHIHKNFIKHKGLWSNTAVHAVSGVSLEIKRGETLGLVGESGSGKSTLGRCLAFLEPLTEGKIFWGEQEIHKLSREQKRELRKKVQVIFQDPLDSLNPHLTIERIVMEPLIYFGIGSLPERQEKVRRMVEKVGLLPELLARYPGQLSRGQCQRVNIARALILEPEIVICDEIISALDVSVGGQIVNLLAQLQKEQGYGYLFISHDLARVAQISHRIAVMYMGKIVEVVKGPQFHLEACHPYSQTLLAAMPRLWSDGQMNRPMPEVAQHLADPVQPPSGCRYHPRCPYATELCLAKEPELAIRNDNHLVACHYLL
ncbi:oligopeptide/dipeptide ABC transporter ATP-binding protein [Paenibacillus sp. SI8]|uniref:oligopeptide/dipeptide ABC transporter ATP-binding protein n=1 Tax=unclassified Paenibacillus TaxID=185978 RepID=UPI003466AFAD